MARSAVKIFTIALQRVGFLLRKKIFLELIVKPGCPITQVMQHLVSKNGQMRPVPFPVLFHENYIVDGRNRCAEDARRLF